MSYTTSLKFFIITWIISSYYLFYYYEYNNKNDNINANNPIASTIAKPKIVKENKEALKDGLRAVALIIDPNTIPIPTPAPPKPEEAKPAPIYFAACNILK